MDIHRCRFVPYQPQCINALAFSHTSDPTRGTPPDLRLALGRANGDIEIWKPNRGNWLQETVLRGGKNRSVEGLLWTQDTFAEDEVSDRRYRDGPLRLFSIGNSPSVTEWDLATGTPARSANSNFSDIWCIASQPRLKDTKGEYSETSLSQLLAAGCGDGTIVLFSTEDNELRFLRSLGKPPTKKPKVLSITWRDANTLVAGYDDSAIRVYDVRNRGANLRTMTLGKPAEGNETYVWSVRCLPDGTILSGDSSGELKIWDSKNYSLVQRLKTHQAHLMDITHNTKGDKIISVGVDRRTVIYQPVAQDGKKRQRWTESMHRRLHQHDVKTIAAYESQELSVIVSGGVDTVPVVAPLKHWERENHRSLSHLPQNTQLSCTSRARFIITWWERQVFVWHLPKRFPDRSSTHSLNDSDRSHDLVARLALKGEENITSAEISQNGMFVLISTVADTKLFQLRMSQGKKKLRIHSRKVELPSGIAGFGARSVSFSPDGRWICAVRTNNVICLAKLMSPSSFDEKATIVDRLVKLHRKGRRSERRQSCLGTYTQTVNCITFSADSRILAAGDISGSIDAWVLEGHEDMSQESTPKKTVKSDQSSMNSSDSGSESDSEDEGENEVIIHGQRWIRNPQGTNLPQLGSSILALSFRSSPSPILSPRTNGTVAVHPTRHTPHPVAQELPQADDRLVAITADHEIIELEVLSCKFSDWSRRNPASLLPKEFTIIKDRAVGCFWDSTGTNQRLWTYGATWLFMLDLSQDLPILNPVGRIGDYNVLNPVTNSSQKKRKRGLEAISRKARRNTGAGDEMSESEVQIGLGKGTQRFTSGDGDRQVVHVEQLPSPPNDDDEASPTLALMRRASSRTQFANDDVVAQMNGHENDTKKEGLTDLVRRQSKKPGWWITLDYRHIFGAAPIGGQESGDGDDATSECLEVVIVERSMYNVELPPRFDGGQDWGT